MTTPTILKSFEKLYADNAQGIEIERLKMQVEALTAGRDALRADAERYRGALLWALYNHQGGSSPIGQPIRKVLVIGQHDRLTPEQIDAAKAAS